MWIPILCFILMAFPLLVPEPKKKKPRAAVVKVPVKVEDSKKAEKPEVKKEKVTLKPKFRPLKEWVAEHSYEITDACLVEGGITKFFEFDETIYDKEAALQYFLGLETVVCAEETDGGINVFFENGL